MGLFRLLAAAAGTGITLALGACGGGGGGGHASSNPTTTTTVAGSSAHPPSEFAGRLLQDNELTGFLISDFSVYRTAGGFVSSEQLSPAAAAAETRMLARNGFRVAAEEDLNRHGMAGLSLVERFGSPAAARTALRFYVAKFRRAGGANDFAFFPVAGVPGAVGFRLGGAGGAGSNVAFADGDYYYLLGEEGSGSGPQDSLGAAARRLYHHVRA
jgi:hypothetical protein